MKFEVYRNNKRLMYIEHKKLIPPIDVIKSMKAAGCTVLLNGKIYKVPKGKQYD